MKRKCLAIGIILLFVGVTIAPTINFQVVKASTDDDLVEVTTQACGIQGYKDTTVKLTREQYQNLEQYLVEFRARLNQTTTREEAIPIFKDAVVELDKYGLLPRGMSVEKAQKLVIEGYKIFQDRDILNTLCNSNKRMLAENINILCYFTGQIDNSYVLTLRQRLLFIPLLLIEILLMPFFDVLPKLIKFIENLLDFIYFNVLSISPIGFNEWICMGVFSGNWPYSILHPSNGWINTIGLNGIKKWEGEFAGGLMGPLGTPRIGAVDFTGLSLYLDNDERFYLGFALLVYIWDY